MGDIRPALGPAVGFLCGLCRCVSREAIRFHISGFRFQKDFFSPQIMNITKCSKNETSAETERDLMLASKFSSWSVMGTGLEDLCPLPGAHSGSLWKGHFSHASLVEQQQPSMW